MSNISIFILNGYEHVHIQKGQKERDWMDETTYKYAYRCLPLSIANQHGWEVITKSTVRVVWDGTDGLDAIKVLEGPKTLAMSHFGFGILTFGLGFLARTAPNINMFVTGAPNQPKRGISPLSGVIETDWNPATFTMNWQFTEANRDVVFKAFEPICFFYPVARELVESTDVELRSMDDHPTEKENYEQWASSRGSFVPTSELGWQKHYFQGIYQDGSKCPIDHQTKLKIKNPVQK